MKLNLFNEGDWDIQAQRRGAVVGGLEEQFAYHRRVLRRMGGEARIDYLRDLDQSKLYEPEFIWDLVRGYDFGGFKKLVREVGDTAIRMGLLGDDEFLHYGVTPFVEWRRGPHLARVVWKSNFGVDGGRARLVLEDAPNWYGDSPVIFAGSIVLEDGDVSFTSRVPLDLGVVGALELVVDLLKRVRAGDRLASSVHVVRR